MAKKRPSERELRFLSGGRAGEVVPLGSKGATIGRDAENDVVIVDDDVSRYHANIFVKKGEWRIEDAGSTNGVYVNGERIDSPCALNNGDRIGIYTYELVFGDSTVTADAAPDDGQHTTSSASAEKQEKATEDKTQKIDLSALKSKRSGGGSTSTGVQGQTEPEQDTGRILLVQEDEEQSERIKECLGAENYTVVPMEHPAGTAGYAKQVAVDLVVLDVGIQKADALEIVGELKSEDETVQIPVLAMIDQEHAAVRSSFFEGGVDDFLTMPVDEIELKSRVRSLVKVKRHAEREKACEKLRSELHEANEATLDTVYRLSRIAEYKDPETPEHVQRMGSYCSAVAGALGLDEDTIEALCYAAPMHDVGKVGVPDKILMKAGKLTEEEWDVMKKHTTIGSDELAGSHAKVVQMAEVIARWHHEKWDGTGYPDGLSGEDIPVVARITGLADFFDSLLSPRPFREAFAIADVTEMILERRGYHFDPDIVDAFWSIEDQIFDIRRQWPDVISYSSSESERVTSKSSS